MLFSIARVKDEPMEQPYLFISHSTKDHRQTEYIVGKLSEERAHDLMHDLLTTVISRSAERVALDLTGLDALDDITAERIAALCKAVVLIGASVVISGLKPDVVSRLVAANIDFSAVKTVRSLKDAIARKR